MCLTHPIVIFVTFNISIMIWFTSYDIHTWDKRIENTIVESLGIELLEINEDNLVGKMPVDKRTVQPMRILHGGASVVLAETLGSIGSAMIVDPEKFIVVGQNISSNHIRPVADGYVFGTAVPVHIGKKSHVWDITIRNEEGKLINLSRLTMAILPKE